MTFLNRLRRLWQLSAIDPATHEDVENLLAHVVFAHKAHEEKLEKLTEWIGVLLKSELLRREAEREPIIPRRRLRE